MQQQKLPGSLTRMGQLLNLVLFTLDTFVCSTALESLRMGMELNKVQKQKKLQPDSTKALWFQL